jgi:membrane-bound metal-dependent hydrolase YbcI (DUF457 family)
MTGKTHQILGISSAATYFLVVSANEYSAATFGAVLFAGHLAALVPDLDESTALLWDNLPLGKVFGTITDPFIRHRNFTHSLLGIGLFGTLVYFLTGLMPDYWHINRMILLYSATISYASHILADMFTVEGVPLFLPFGKMVGIPPKPLDGIRIQTGKWFENLIIFPLLDIYLVILFVSYWDKIRRVLFK